MDDEDPLGLGRKGVDPRQQAVFVCVAGQTGQLADLRPHLDGLAEQFDIGSTFNEGAAQCADGLIAHKEDGTLRPPEVVLEMVADAAGLAHAAGREDDLRLPIGVDHPGFVAGHADPQAGALDGVDALGQQGAGRLVKTVGVGIPEDAGRLDGKRAVDVHREIAVALDQTFFLDLPDKIKQLLRAAHCETGDDHIAAPVEGALQYSGQFADVIRAGAVEPVAVGGFHHHIVGIGQIGRVLDEGLVLVADVAGEDELGGGAVLRHPDRNAGRPQQMAHVHELDHKAGGQFQFRVVIHAPEQLDGRFGILDGIHRLHRLGTGALALAVLPLRLKLLDVGRVSQHDAAQLHGGVGGIDPAPEPVAGQQRQQAGVVDVSMGRQHTVDLAGGHGDGLVFIGILALLHAAVDEIALPGGFQQGTAARHLMVRAQKCQFHPKAPPDRCSLPFAPRPQQAKRDREVLHLYYNIFSFSNASKSRREYQAERRIFEKFFIQS